MTIITTKRREHRTAATADYLIERIGPRVALCEWQGDQWITIRSRIDRSTAAHFGFNLDAPSVLRVFAPGREVQS